jgi:hypothetical protein
MKKQYKALLWILLIVSLSYLYQNYKKQKTQIAPRAEVKDQEQLIVKKKTQKLPTTNVTNYLQVGN